MRDFTLDTLPTRLVCNQKVNTVFSYSLVCSINTYRDSLTGAHINRQRWQVFSLSKLNEFRGSSLSGHLIMFSVDYFL